MWLVKWFEHQVGLRFQTFFFSNWDFSLFIRTRIKLIFCHWSWIYIFKSIELMPKNQWSETLRNPTTCHFIFQKIDNFHKSITCPENQGKGKVTLPQGIICWSVGLGPWQLCYCIHIKHAQCLCTVTKAWNA